MNKKDKLAIKSKPENPSVPQNTAWQYNVTNLT